MAQNTKKSRRVGKLRKPVNWLIMLVLLTAFQLSCAISIKLNSKDIPSVTIATVFGAYLFIEWIYFIFYGIILKRKSFEIELIAFYLTGLGLAITTSVYPDKAIVQFIAILAGIITFILLLWILADIERVIKLRRPVAIVALIVLVITLILAKDIHGARNWIFIGNFSIQPSEIIKIAFIFVGAATLEYLQTTRSLTIYLAFALSCIGGLFIMRDFGTALIFFFTFIVLAFMRSGDIRTLLLVCAGATVGGGLVLTFKPYVLRRFKTYRHIWEFADGKGYQQVRVLIFSVSGGLFGVGLGNGKLRHIFAATEDLAFGMVAEEFGLIIAFSIILTYVALLVYSIRYTKGTRSAFYSIAAVSAASLMLFQASLHIFGITDLLPWTGVTLPFISRGGSSIICCWGLAALIKSVDIRTYKRYDKFRNIPVITEYKGDTK